MKKAITLFLTAVLFAALAGCGRQDAAGENGENTESKYAQSVDVLNAVVESYAEEDLFALYGGDQANAVMDAPAAFDVSKTDELELTLGLPAEQFSNVEDAASMVHMMNANTFTGAAYRLKDGVDINTFADSVKSNILQKQWICGTPDTFLVIQADDRYAVTAYGEAGIMETFKNNAISALDGAKVITETSIS